MKQTLHCAAVWLLLAILNAHLVTAHAQGTAFTYQGRLNVSGAPASGSYDLAFTLYTNNVAGTAIAGPVTNSAVAVTNGLFTTLVNFGSAFAGGSNWLAIAVSTNAANAYSPLAPRQQITPTPYAVYSATAGNAVTAGSAASAASAATATTANNFSGSLAGDVTGTQSATVVSSVGGQSAANVAGGATAANAATSANTASTIVRRDASGNFSAGTIAANSFSGNGGGLTNLTAAQLTSGVVSWSVLPGFQSSSNYSTVGGGQNNVIAASGDHSVIGGGFNNTIGANDYQGTIAGGYYNTLLSGAGYSAIGGGQYNTNSSNEGTIGGGQNNLASGLDQSTVGGGYENIASGNFATVPGGYQNVAAGNASFAAGARAQATNDAAFVWADNSVAVPFASTNNNSFNVRALGGVKFVTSGAGLTVDGQPVLAGQNGGGLTNLNASQLASGTISLAQLPGSVITNGASGITVSGSFTGNGGGLTDLNASQLTSIGNSDGGIENFFVGPSGNSSTSGGDNTAMGVRSLIYNGSGGYNTAVGWQALNYNSSGSGNTAFGASALFSTENGGNNTAIGDSALLGVFSVQLLGYSFNGTNNIALGYQAGINLANGSTNIYIGNPGVNSESSTIRIGTPGIHATTYIAGVINGDGGGLTDLAVSASQLTSIGNSDGGIENFFVGPSGNSSTSGGDNTAMGVRSLIYNGSGGYNTAVGWQALNYNSSGSGNTAFGASALFSTENGGNNTAIGDSALLGVFSVQLLGYSFNGTNNIALGYQAGINLANGSTNIYIGNPGVNSESSTIRIGTPGIHATTYIAGVINGNGGGLTNLSAANLVGAFTGTTTINNPGGANSLNVYGTQTGGWANPVSLFENKSTAATASPALRVLCDGGTNLDGALSVSVSTGTTGLIAEFGNSTAFVVRITNNGSIFAQGNVYANGVLLTSDRNLKENFTALDGQAVLAKVASLPLTKWNYKTDKTGVQHIGPMAQDFHAAFLLDGADDKHISVVDEGGVALAAIQGLNEKLETRSQDAEGSIQKLLAETKDKDTEIEKLKQRVDALEKLILNQKQN